MITEYCGRPQLCIADGIFKSSCHWRVVNHLDGKRCVHCRRTPRRCIVQAKVQTLSEDEQALSSVSRRQQQQQQGSVSQVNWCREPKLLPKIIPRSVVRSRRQACRGFCDRPSQALDLSILLTMDLIELNVGGVAYTTSRMTLTQYDDSMLGHMFAEDMQPGRTDSQGRSEILPSACSAFQRFP